jgi:WD40 repeat protein
VRLTNVDWMRIIGNAVWMRERRAPQEEKKLYVWDIRTGKSIRSLALPASREVIDVHPRGKSLLLHDGEGQVRLFGADGKRELWKFPSRFKFVFIPAFSRFSPCRRWLAHEDQKSVHVLDLKTLESKKVADVTRLQWLAWSADGRWLALHEKKGKSISIREVSTGTLRQTLPATPLCKVALGPDGQCVALLDPRAGKLAVHPLGQLVPGFLLVEPPPAPDVACGCLGFSPAGRHLASSSVHDVRLHNADGTLIRRLAGHEKGIYRLVFSNDGRRLVSVSGDGTALVWEVKRPGKGDRQFEPMK